MLVVEIGVLAYPVVERDYNHTLLPDERIGLAPSYNPIAIDPSFDPAE
jgi:hypothetical protein